ncbi:MAG: hypothetical protein GY697_18895 [Desulfobacterales bacterium]|nr:hypothetical protein [Desulfobacterales bacterium]
MFAAVKATQKKYCSRAIVAAIIAGLPFIIGGYAPIGKGLILGTIFSIINFILIGETLPTKIGAGSGRKLFARSLGLVGVRFCLLAIPIISAIKFTQFELVTTVIGIFMVPATIIADHSMKLIASARRRRA